MGLFDVERFMFVSSRFRVAVYFPSYSKTKDDQTRRMAPIPLHHGHGRCCDQSVRRWRSLMEDEKAVA